MNPPRSTDSSGARADGIARSVAGAARWTANTVRRHHVRRYLAGHGAVTATAAVLMIAGLNWVVGDMVFRIGQQQPVSVPVMAIIPALLAASMVVLTPSRARLVDRAASRSLLGCRLALDAGLLTLALGALRLSSPALPGDALGSGAGLRNLIGLTGLAWLASTVLGEELAWIPPTALVLVAMIVGLQPTPVAGLWSWLLSNSASGSALTVAVSLLAAGLGLRAVATHLQVRPLVQPDAWL